MRKTWTDAGWDDYLYWQQQDKKTLRKVNDLIKDNNSAADLQRVCKSGAELMCRNGATKGREKRPLGNPKR